MTETVSVFDEMEQYKPIPYATKWQRFANYLIDLILCYAIAFLIALALAIYSEYTENTVMYEFLVSDDRLTNLCQKIFFAALMVIVYTLMEGASKGRSAGKFITGTKAVKLDGTPINWKDAFKRSLYRLIPFEQFGIFSGQLLHDRGPKTMVVKTRGV